MGFRSAFVNQLKTIPSKLPSPVKRSGHAIIDGLDARWRHWRFAQHVRAFRATPAAFFDSRRLAAMHWAWGNENWSADAGYLEALARRMARTTGAVLECGSGLSTIVLGVLAERRGVQVLSLEQDAWWASYVQSELTRLHITQVELVHTPLIAHDDFMWFDVARVKFPYSFELVVCDGPAIYGHPEPYQSAWRVGLLSVLRDHGVRADEILLDDAEDPRLGSLRARWERQHDFATQIAQTATGSYLIARAAGLDGDLGGRAGRTP